MDVSIFDVVDAHTKHRTTYCNVLVFLVVLSADGTRSVCGGVVTAETWSRKKSIAEGGVDVFSYVKEYRANGFLPFPLATLGKSPAVMRSSDAERAQFYRHNNIGLFAGHPDGFIIVDADSPASMVFVTNRLVSLGLYDWTTIVLTPKRQSNHFWLRVSDIPSTVQSYYKLPRHIGDGEIRIRRPAYVAAPGSVIAEGEYTFVQGGIQFFTTQPVLPFADLKWILPSHAIRPPGRTETTVDVTNFEYNPNPPIVRMFHFLKVARGHRVHKINMRTGEILEETYPSRSEAEQSLVMGLVRAGWTQGMIQNKFEEEQPGHYADVLNPEKYIARAYEKAVSFINKGRRK